MLIIIFFLIGDKFKKYIFVLSFKSKLNLKLNIFKKNVMCNYV